MNGFPKVAEPAPGTGGRLLNPVVGDGEGGDSTGLFAETLRYTYCTLPTATDGRPASMVTQAPEFRSDWRLR